jgi:predicted KAP-like P-loop ATPase
MWSDNETTVDYLNFGIVADACTKLLQQAGGEPISVGISGGWGAGKTSLVRMIEARLKAAAKPDENTYVVVTFNPWLYQDFEGARSALLQLVGDEVLRLAARNQSLAKKAKRILQRINLLRVVQLGGEAAATLYTGIPIGSIGQAVLKVGEFLGVGEQDENADSEEKKDKGDKKDDSFIKPAEPISLPNEIQAFRDALEELLEELKVTLVVFVDDLDRCLPRTAISTLESIRLLLFLKRSAFVIAADNDFIRGAVQVHFEGAGISSEVATNYFDKLIQVPLHVPRLGVNEAKAYLALLLMERAYKEGRFDKVGFDNALKLIPARLQSSWRGETITSEFLQVLVGQDNKEMLALMELAEGLAPLLAQSIAVNANPRLIKRFLNTVYLRSALAEPQGIELDIPSLAKWHLIERCDAELANALAAQVNSDSEGRIEALRLAEEAASNLGEQLSAPFADNAFTRQWLQLHPALGDTDLRSLLHLSRDTATRDFGADDLTATGRELRDALVTATSSNAPLTQAISAAGEYQAEKAMVRAWQIKAPKRTWRSADDLIPLEPTKVFQQLGAKAAALIAKAPVTAVGPGIIPALYALSWARPILDKWLENPSLDANTKKAIEAKKKG